MGMVKIISRRLPLPPLKKKKKQGFPAPVLAVLVLLRSGWLQTGWDPLPSTSQVPLLFFSFPRRAFSHIDSVTCLTEPFQFFGVSFFSIVDRRACTVVQENWFLCHTLQTITYSFLLGSVYLFILVFPVLWSRGFSSVTCIFFVIPRCLLLGPHFVSDFVNLGIFSVAFN